MNTIILSILIGLVAGVAAGLLGIGGAVIIIPLLIYLFDFDQHVVQGTTLMAMVPPIGLLAALEYYKAGNVKISIAICIAIGFFFGGFIGAHFANKVTPYLLKKIFGIFLLLIAIKFILDK